MSRIGIQSIKVPEGVEVKISTGKISAKGKLGVLEMPLDSRIGIESKENELIVSCKVSDDAEAAAMWGTTRALLANIVTGVSGGFVKKLEIQGVGYRASSKGKQLTLEVGFSHSVEMEVPEELEIEIKKNIITVRGIDKQKVGQFSAEIRGVRPPEPYKGKGIRYVDEYVIRKEGKKAVGAEGTV